MSYFAVNCCCEWLVILIQGDQKVSMHLKTTVQKHAKIQNFKQNTLGMWTVLYWTRSSRTQFGVSINVWRLAWDNLNIACNHQVHRDFNHPVLPKHTLPGSWRLLAGQRPSGTGKSLCPTPRRQLRTMFFTQKNTVDLHSVGTDICYSVMCG